MIFLYGFIAICAGLASIGCFWPAGPLIALASAPLAGSAAVAIVVAFDLAGRPSRSRDVLWWRTRSPHGQHP